MRRRIAGAAHTGLGGNSAPEMVAGADAGSEERKKLINVCAKDCYETFFKGSAMDDGYCDAGARDGEVSLGIEPGYMYNPLRVIKIYENKRYSKYITGYAWGAWGSGIRSTVKYYSEYKYRGKFVRFVDKWHPLLFPDI